MGAKIPRVGAKITRGILAPGDQAAQGAKINCYTGCVDNNVKFNIRQEHIGDTLETRYMHAGTLETRYMRALYA